MSDRELLEKQAGELGVKVTEGISDDDLLKLLEAAKARAALEARATELSVEFAPNIGDKKLTQRIADAELKLAGGDEDEDAPDGAGFIVMCAVAEGRRRAGRRWPGGKTNVPADDMTAEMLAALKKDPLFQVSTPSPE